MDRNEGLGLFLSLGSSKSHQHPQLNLMPSVSQWSNLLAFSSVRRQSPEDAMLKGFTCTAERESEEEVGTSSTNSALSSVSGKRDHVLTISGSSGGEEVFSDEDGGDGSRKKLRLSKDQSAVLEETFKEHDTLNPKQKQTLAKQLNLRPRQVEVWFQNRRARTKLKQTEVDCEFLKRCCENLTNENRRLQKEVAELRALKLSPQFYMPMIPPTTLTMCPSCERIATSNNGADCAAASSTMHANVEHHFLQHAQQQQSPFAGTGAKAMPWAPVPLRTASFLDAMHRQRS